MLGKGAIKGGQSCWKGTIMATRRRELAHHIAERTQDAYSFCRYAPGAWEACAFMLLGHGYTEQNVEAILRSKWMRWAGDMSSNRYGRVNSADLKRFMEDPRNRITREAVEQLTQETFSVA